MLTQHSINLQEAHNTLKHWQNGMAGFMPNTVTKKNIMLTGTGISINNPTTFLEFSAQD